MRRTESMSGITRARTPAPTHRIAACLGRGLAAGTMLIVASAAGAADGLCHGDEHVVFSCRIGTTAKQVALCASQSFPAGDAALAYRFGRPDHLELAFPSEPRGSLQRFRHAHYFRYQVDRSEASFDNDGVTYTVFDYYDGD